MHMHRCAQKLHPKPSVFFQVILCRFFYIPVLSEDALKSEARDLKFSDFVADCPKIGDGGGVAVTKC